MPPQHFVGLELRALHNLLRRFADKVCMAGEPRDFVRLMHGHVLMYLATHPQEDVFQRDLEQAFEIRGPTATKILQSMVKLGLITRHDVPYDARLKKLVLTEKAEAIHARMSEKAVMFDRVLTAGLSEAECAFLLTIIDKMKHNLLNALEQKPE